MVIAVRGALALPGLLFLVIGLRWLADPGSAAAELGMDLLTDLGLSSQIGDMGSFFLTLGACILLGAATRKRYWFYPAVMLLGFAAFSRAIAWQLHGAAPAFGLIGFEVVVATALWFGSGFISGPKNLSPES